MTSQTTESSPREEVADRTITASAGKSPLPSPEQAAAYRRYRQSILDGTIRRPRPERARA